MKWFNNLRVAVKVAIGCGLFIVLIVVITVMSNYMLNVTEKNFNSFYADRFIPIKDLNQIQKNLLQMRINMLQEQLAAEHGDWETVNERIDSSTRLGEEYNKLWDGYMETRLTDEEAKLASQFKENAAAAAAVRGRFAEAVKAGNFSQSQQLLDEWLIGFRKVRDTMNQLLDLQVRVGEELKTEAENLASMLVNVLFGVLGVSLLFGGVITFVLARSIKNPVQKGLEFAKRIADGDFTERIDLDQDDELGQLGKALNKAADNLETLVSDVVMSSQNLAQAVDQISSGNQNLSQRTSEQASSLEEIASTIEEATSTIKQNGDNAKEANELADTSSKKANDGGQLVKDAVVSINEINASSKRIEEIINVINEIAFQTNLLALNAAVEAARAGDQGRGFAVVAGEVRNLAQRSGNAAKEIGELIKDSVNKIDNGTDLVNRSGESLNEIIDAVKRVGGMINEIAAASDEQNRGMDQINVAISDMDNMTQQNAALVEETASASEEMSNQAQELLTMMEKFKVRNENLEKGTGRKKMHIKAAEKAAAKSNEGNGRDRGEVQTHEAMAAQAREKNQDVKSMMSDEGFEEF
ncbi:MAG: methyl-accepting chemotaxis protein [Spirochaetota bacterium]